MDQPAPRAAAQAPHIPLTARLTRRTALLGLATAGAATALTPLPARAAPDVVRIALPTKTYYPTVITEAAIRQKFFDRQGIGAEATVFRGGAECIEAMAAGAADVSLGGPGIIGVAVRKGINLKLVATSTRVNCGWFLLVRADSPVTRVEDLAGKKVGITSAGSGSDVLALWTNEARKTPFTRVPVGGGGLVPNLKSGNLDAAVIYSPLSFELILSKQVRVLVDYAAEMPPQLVGGWAVTGKLIADKPGVVQKTMNALYDSLLWMRANRDAAIALIAEVDEIKPDIAAMEYEQTILKLATDTSMGADELQRALDTAKLIGITDTAPNDQIIDTRFKPVGSA
jgi:NitT/TauT family transport system substrate-binding protein